MPDPDNLSDAYLTERHTSDRAELDRWWAMQVPTAQPDSGPSGTPKADIGMTITPSGPKDPTSTQMGMVGQAAGAVAGAVNTALDVAFNPPLIDRAIKLMGGSPTTITGIEDAIKAGGRPEEMEEWMRLPEGVRSVIESSVSQVHALGPGKPPIQPTPETPTRPVTPEQPAAQQLLSGEGMEGTQARVNTGRLSDRPEALKVLETVNKLNVESGATETAVRGVVSREATQQAAKGAVTVEQLLDRQPGQMLAGIPLDEQITAARRLRVTSAKYLTQLAGRVANGDAEASALIYDALAVHGKIDEAVTGMSAEIGRALSAHNIMASSERRVFDPSAMSELADRFRGVNPATGMVDEIVPPEQVARMILSAEQIGGRRAVHTLARDAVKHPWANALLEAWINGLLSGPQTHAANFLSNAMTSFWAVPERALAARLHPTVDIGVMKGEATQMLYALVSGTGDALSVAARSFKAGEPVAGLSKVEHAPAITAEMLNLGGPMGRAVDFLGQVIRTPGRALMAGDEFFKAINYRMELHAQAFRQAATEGLDGSAMGRRIAQIVADPPATIKQAADGFAAYQTFTTELGPVGQGFMDFANAHPALRVVLPFVRTPTNIFKFAVERMPLVNLMAEHTRSAIRQGGPARDLALARMSMGGAIMGTLGSLAASGTITGDGPHDPVLRKRLTETGWQPYSVKVGDTYYSYNRLDPIGMLIGVAANIAELSGELPRADLDQLAMAAVLGTMEAFTSKTYLQGIANVLEAIKSPDEAGLSYLRSLSRSLIPAGLAQVERTLDPAVRETNSLIDEMRARVPGFSSDLPPRRNLWGEPILLGGGLGPDLISPVYTSTEKADPVSDEIVRLQMRLTMPSKYIAGSPVPSSPFAQERASHGVELTPQEYDLLVRLVGNELKGEGGRGLHDALGRLIDTPQYQRQSDGPDGGKALLIGRYVQKYKEAAQLELRRRSPQLDALIKARQIERKEAMTPEPEDLARVLGVGR